MSHLVGSSGGSGMGLGFGFSFGFGFGRGGLPAWLGVLGALGFGGVLAGHLRHAVGAHPVPRRCWHWGHALMAFSMIVMYLPAALDPLAISLAAWRAVFVVALVALVGLAVNGVTGHVERRGVSALWLLLAGDMVVMLYMWSPGAWTAPLSVVAVAFLLAETGLWASGRVVLLDRPLGPFGFGLAVSGGLGFTALTLGDRHPDPQPGPARELRASMTAMALGMAYMVLVMAA